MSMRVDGLDENSIPINCPECDAEFTVSLKAVAEERTVFCPAGHDIVLEDEGGGGKALVQSLEKASRSFRR